MTEHVGHTYGQVCGNSGLFLEYLEEALEIWRCGQYKIKTTVEHLLTGLFVKIYKMSQDNIKNWVHSLFF